MMNPEDFMDIIRNKLELEGWELLGYEPEIAPHHNVYRYTGKNYVEDVCIGIIDITIIQKNERDIDE